MSIKDRLKDFKKRMGPSVKELRFIISRMKRSPLSIVGVAILVFYIVVGLLAPVLAPPTRWDPYMIPRDGYGRIPKPPYSEHWFGTTEGQFDIYYGCIWGTRTAFRVGFIVVLGALAIGLFFGVISAYYGGYIDELMMRFTDVIYAFPSLILCMALIVALPSVYYFNLGPIALVLAGVVMAALGGALPKKRWFRLAFILSGICLISVALATVAFPNELNLVLGPKMRYRFHPLDKVMLAIVIVGWPTYTRVIRGEVLRVKQEDYVEAARAVGCSNFRVITKHILPNSIYPVIIMASLDIGAIVLTAAALSFLGLGAPEGYADWGQMINFSRGWIGVKGYYYWFTWLIPGLFIFIFVLGWNLLGDAFRDILDPMLRRR